MNVNWFHRLIGRQKPLTQFDRLALPPKSRLACECDFLVIDLETTGLDLRKDRIVSVGWMPVRKREILLAEARHYLVQSPVSVGQSAIVHGLHDRDLKNAHQINDVLTELFSRYSGYVFAAHHANLDRSFLYREAKRCFGAAPELCFIDTLAIERHRLERAGIIVKSSALRLPDCLQRHHLPAGISHNAVEDAYGCALLLLAQLSGSEFSLAEFMRQSR